MYSEVLPGASTVLTTSVLMRSLDVKMQARAQESPGIRQSYNPYTERVVKVANHQCLFNYLDQCLVVVIIVVNKEKNVCASQLLLAYYCILLLFVRT